MTLVVLAFYGVVAGVARTHLLARPAVVRRLQKMFSLALVGPAGQLAATTR